MKQIFFRKFKYLFLSFSIRFLNEISFINFTIPKHLFMVENFLSKFRMEKVFAKIELNYIIEKMYFVNVNVVFSNTINIFNFSEV
jgi:hypothetical protein